MSLSKRAGTPKLLTIEPNVRPVKSMAPPLFSSAVFCRPSRTSPQPPPRPTQLWRSKPRVLSACVPLSALMPISSWNLA